MEGTRGQTHLALLLALGRPRRGLRRATPAGTGLSRDDCLRELSLANLKERLKACDAVVAAFPKDPAPLNDRYLLHSLAGNDQAACADLRKAVTLARGHAERQLDGQLRIDLEVREQLCKDPLPAAGQP
jgi:hypothetical protein